MLNRRTTEVAGVSNVSLDPQGLEGGGRIGTVRPRDVPKSLNKSTFWYFVTYAFHLPQSQLYNGRAVVILNSSPLIPICKLLSHCPITKRRYIMPP